MAGSPSRLLRGNWVNERVSATEWPLDHPFYCLTNSPCLCHLTAQKDPQDRGGGEGGKLYSSRVMEAAGRRSRKPWKSTKRERLKCCAISFQIRLEEAGLYKLVFQFTSTLSLGGGGGGGAAPGPDGRLRQHLTAEALSSAVVRVFGHHGGF